MGVKQEKRRLKSEIKAQTLELNELEAKIKYLNESIHILEMKNVNKP